MALPSSYGWAALGFFLLIFVTFMVLWVRNIRREAARVEDLLAKDVDAVQKAREQAQVVEVDRRDLGPTPGVQLRPSDRDVERGPSSSPPSH